MNHTIRRTIAVLCLLLGGFVAPSASAQTVQEFATVAPTDMSAQFMTAIFGPSFQSAGGFGGATTPGTGDLGPAAVVGNAGQGILGVLAQVMSDACLALTVLIIFITGVTSNLQAAYDGIRAGEKYSSLWIPIRSSMSFLLLVPVSGGYCLIQVLTFKVILLSIGIANAGYNAALNHFQAGGGIVYSKPVKRGAEAANTMAEIKLCEALMVDEDGQSLINAKETTDSDNLNEGWTSWLPEAFIQTFNSGSLTYQKTYPIASNAEAGNGSCGSINLTMTFEPQTADMVQAAFDQTVAALQALENNIEGPAKKVAEQLIKKDGSTTFGEGARTLYEEWGPSVYAAATQYDQSTSASLSSIAQQAIPKIENLDKIRSAGWIMTGALYWQLSASQDVARAILTSSPSLNGPDMELYTESLIAKSIQTNLTGYNAAIASINDDSDIMSDDYKWASSAARSTPTSGVGAVTSYLRQVFSLEPDTLVEFVVGNSKEENFVQRMTGLGQYMFNTGATIYIASVAAAELNQNESSIGNKVKDALSANFISKSVGKIVGWAAGIAAFLSIPMMLIGAFLGYYLPFIPFLLWLINVTNWFGVCIKAVFATPIWAVAHAIPEGDGWAGQRAQQGYLLIISLALYPLLMMTGLFVGMVLIEVIGRLVAIMFPVFIQGKMGDYGIFSQLLMVAILAGACIQLATKAFAMSADMPDETLKWINGGIAGITDNQDNSGIRATYAAIIGGGNSKLESGQRDLSSRKAASQAKGATNPNSTPGANADKPAARAKEETMLSN